MIFCARATRGLRRPSLDARSGRSFSPHPWEITRELASRFLMGDLILAISIFPPKPCYLLALTHKPPQLTLVSFIGSSANLLLRQTALAAMKLLT